MVWVAGSRQLNALNEGNKNANIFVVMNMRDDFKGVHVYVHGCGHVAERLKTDSRQHTTNSRQQTAERLKTDSRQQTAERLKTDSR
jgi:hypothetical protein